MHFKFERINILQDPLINFTISVPDIINTPLKRKKNSAVSESANIDVLVFFNTNHFLLN